ncbi:MAG: GTP 3',8-cyclase MoaA [Spirochaetales bacterium]|nr:GTP 3',8-cyclase MoaA [Spirochaetales bacterium]
MVLDRLGRPLRDLRISVIDNCNFRCTYCMPRERFPEDYAFLKQDDLLKFTEILRLVGAFRQLGLKKVKITGGEPLLRPLVSELVGSLKSNFPELEVGLITNGLHLKPLLNRLKSNGLDQITVSLDALDPERFAAITGNGHRVQTIVDAIEAAAEIFPLVKVNTVLIKGQNDDQVEVLAQYFRRPGFALRFIEYMDVGNLNGWRRDLVVPESEVLSRLSRLGVLSPLPKRHAGETATRWGWMEGGEVGFISSITQPFCGDCSRARLSADGKLYTCLFAKRGWDLRAPLRSGADESRLAEVLNTVWSGRTDQYSELRERLRDPEKKIEMFAIGG